MKSRPPMSLNMCGAFIVLAFGYHTLIMHAIRQEWYKCIRRCSHIYVVSQVNTTDACLSPCLPINQNASFACKHRCHSLGQTVPCLEICTLNVSPTGCDILTTLHIWGGKASKIQKLSIVFQERSADHLVTKAVARQQHCGLPPAAIHPAIHQKKGDQGVSEITAYCEHLQIV